MEKTRLYESEKSAFMLRIPKSIRTKAEKAGVKVGDEVIIDFDSSKKRFIVLTDVKKAEAAYQKAAQNIINGVMSYPLNSDFEFPEPQILEEESPFSPIPFSS